jgi:hypothetical protein
MPRISEMHPSKWLSAGDLDDQDVIVTVSGCTQENMGNSDRGDDEYKWILWFEELDKGMVMNVTRTNVIAKVLMSDNTDDWIGKKITIFPSETIYKGETKATIGVRSKPPRSQKPMPAKATSGNGKPSLKPQGKPAPTPSTSRRVAPMTQDEVDADDDLNQGTADEDDEIPY